MDLFLPFLTLILILFIAKIYFLQNTEQEGMENEKDESENDEIIEGMKDSPDAFEKIVDNMQDLRKVYRRNTIGYLKEYEKIKRVIPLIKLLKTPKIKLKGGGKLFAPLLKGITKPFTDIAGFFVKAANGIIKIANMIIELINKVIYYSKCAFMLLINFFIVPCVFWYLLNLIGCIIYLPFAFIFWFIGINDVVEDYVWGTIYVFDEFMYDFSGYHFAHFPDFINKQCYSCQSNFKSDDSMLNLDFIGDMLKDAFRKRK